MNLNFLDRPEWKCAWCDKTLDEACRARYPMLYDHQTMTVKSYYEKRQRQYRWDRTQGSPKLTCSRDCGFAYKAWKLNLDSRKSYITEPFTCDKCHRGATGGRLLKKGKRDYKMCRKCYRQRTINHLRGQWEYTHKEHRSQYMKQYRRDHAVASNP